MLSILCFEIGIVLIFIFEKNHIFEMLGALYMQLRNNLTWTQAQISMF